MISKSFITRQLKEIIEKLDWETADGRGQAVTIAHQIRADLDRILSSQSSGIDMEQVLKLRARLAKATDELDRGLVATALSEYQAALAEWSGPPK